MVARRRHSTHAPRIRADELLNDDDFSLVLADPRVSRDELCGEDAEPGVRNARVGYTDGGRGSEERPLRHAPRHLKRNNSMQQRAM